MGRLKKIFSPKNIAFIGASEEKDSIGRSLMKNLTESFEGEIIPVNPKKESVLGYDCLDSVNSIEKDVDLAVIATPPSVVFEVLEEIGNKGIKNVVVITAGFAETGKKGRKRQEKLKDIAEKYELNLVGPNCLGVINTSNNLNTTFANQKPIPGNISFLSQSGAFITAVLDWSVENNVGFKDIVSLGNEAVLNSTDFIKEWGKDPQTEVILGYLEQIKNGREFIDNVREVTNKEDTPVVILKSGRTEKGAEAAASHTGSMAGSYTAYKTGLKQAGAIQVDNVEEFFDLGHVLSFQPIPPKKTVGVVTNAGGPGVLTTDAIGNSEIELSEFSKKTKKSLKNNVPAQANLKNPLDIIGDADADRFEKAIDIVLKDKNTGGAIVVAAPTDVLNIDELAEKTISLYEKYEKPVIACFMGERSTRKAEQTLENSGIPNYFNPERAVKSFEVLEKYRQIKDWEYQDPKTFEVDKQKAREILDLAKEYDTDYLGVEAMGLLDAYGISTPKGKVVDDANKAEKIAKEIDGKVVMKIASPDIIHKSDIGCVQIGIEPENVQDVFEEIYNNAYNHKSDAEIIGVQVQEMIDIEPGEETIVGANRDPQFGPLLMFGFGGIFVQIFEDTTFRVAPVSEKEARNMTKEIKSSELIRGARGREPLYIDGIVETIQRISQMVTDFPQIKELDINPLVAMPNNVYAVDFRITLDID